MTRAIVKTSKVVKEITSNVRTSFDVFDRARDIYLAQIRRAEHDYYERIRRATAIITGEAEDAGEEAPRLDT
jgi:L-fucose mutarotase/ribose pyranase (RbsD/FucU family)